MGGRRARIQRPTGAFIPSSSPVKSNTPSPPKKGHRAAQKGVQEEEYIDIYQGDGDGDSDDDDDDSSDDGKMVQTNKDGTGRRGHPESAQEAKEGEGKNGDNSESSSEEDNASLSDLIDNDNAAFEEDGSDDYEPLLRNGPCIRQSDDGNDDDEG